MQPNLSLTFALRSNKGAYALLLGSGVSRGAGIPTGWEIVLDLIQQIAVIRGENCGPDPVAWYQSSFGELPEYSRLLDRLCTTDEERRALLRSYFDPAESDREVGLRTSTDAHRAIALLVKAGYIRVILTTNFDRLMERALDELGVAPTVLRTPDAVSGMIPLAHQECLIVKLHGDYLDGRLRNTPKELEDYDSGLNQLLDRVLDEFGLVVAGWSGEWDTALRSVLCRCNSRRFTTFWLARGPLGEKAQELVDLRQARVIEIDSADAFFGSLQESIDALDAYAAPHPLSTEMARQLAKRYLEEDRYRIRLHDMVMAEVEKVLQITAEMGLNFHLTAEELNRRIKTMNAATEILRVLVATGCYWGGPTYSDLWVKALESLSNPPKTDGLTVWVDLQLYPALLFMYTAGVSAIAAKNYQTFIDILMQAKTLSDNEPVILSLSCNDVLPHRNAHQLDGYNNNYTPLNDLVFELLGPLFHDSIRSSERYERFFDKFEYLSALIFVDTDTKRRGDAKEITGPVGRFGWKQGKSNRIGFRDDLLAEIGKAGSDWEPLKRDLFSRSMNKFVTLMNRFDTEVVQKRAWH